MQLTQAFIVHRPFLGGGTRYLSQGVHVIMKASETPEDQVVEIVPRGTVTEMTRGTTDLILMENGWPPFNWMWLF